MDYNGIPPTSTYDIHIHKDQYLSDIKTSEINVVRRATKGGGKRFPLPVVCVEQCLRRRVLVRYGDKTDTTTSWGKN